MGLPAVFDVLGHGHSVAQEVAAEGNIIGMSCRNFYLDSPRADRGPAARIIEQRLQIRTVGVRFAASVLKPLLYRIGSKRMSLEVDFFHSALPFST